MVRQQPHYSLRPSTNYLLMAMGRLWVKNALLSLGSNHAIMGVKQLTIIWQLLGNRM
jgi:hypothetical protein